jgi:hypothetical protein
MRNHFFVTVVLALSAAIASPAQAQVAPQLTEQRPAGWSFTPAMDYAFVWDSNVLWENVGSDIVAEPMHILKPNGVLSFNNRRTTFDAQYSGAFVQHVELASLNSYDQNLTVNASRQLTRRSTWFARHSATLSPTTELVELVGVPFMRIGVHREDLRTGVELLLDRRTTISSSYNLQWVAFDSDSELLRLRGGHNQGGNVELRRALTDRLFLAGEFDLQLSQIRDGREFTTQNSWGGVEYRFSEYVQASGGLGVSRLSGAEGQPARTGPAVRLGLSRTTPNALMSVQFSRSYVPSYGFGGTSDNQELTTRLRVPITRRLVTNSSLSLRRNDPLDGNSTYSLRSLWFHTGLGYQVLDWMWVEGFTGIARQMSNQVDGRINRHQFGVQVTAAKTTRIR